MADIAYLILKLEIQCLLYVIVDVDSVSKSLIHIHY